MRLVDTHSHIHDSDFDADRAETLARASGAGVQAIVALGVTLANTRDAIALAEAEPLVWAAAGVHPHDAKDATEADLGALEELAAHPKVALVGEIGLDYYRNLSPRDQQMRVMRRQLETARRVAKPVAVHARDAHADMLPLLSEWSASMGGRLPDGRPLGVMHYFSEDAEMAARYIDLGFVISVHTSVTHPKAATLHDVARRTPMAHLVVETDSPYGAPQRVRGKRNEPAYVADAVAKVAELQGIPPDQAARITADNALRLLGVAVAGAC